MGADLPTPLQGARLLVLGNLTPELGITLPSRRQARLKADYDAIAELHLSGRASWQWVVFKVDELLEDGLRAPELYEHPLSAISTEAGPLLVAETCRRQLAAP